MTQSRLKRLMVIRPILLGPQTPDLVDGSAQVGESQQDPGKTLFYFHLEDLWVTEVRIMSSTPDEDKSSDLKSRGRAHTVEGEK